MRVEPVGHDGQNASYWNFNDERLYKEEAPEEPVDKHKFVLIFVFVRLLRFSEHYDTQYMHSW